MRQMKENGPIELAARLCAGLILLLLAAACLSSARAVDKRDIGPIPLPRKRLPELRPRGGQAAGQGSLLSHGGIS